MKKIIVFLALILVVYSSTTKKEYKKEVEYIKSVIGSKYNKDYCILIDFSKHSGNNRMFIYNMKTNSIERSFLVAHGEGSNQRLGKPTKFSNAPGSFSSSLGISVLEGRDYSSLGINIKYWIKGLEKTNSNLRRRAVVLHSSHYIPNFEVYPFPILQSQGCPTVSDKTMKELDKLIKKQDNKKIIIYSFK